ncbi:MAG: nucleotidyltransferase family protein [Candidatus Marsarchaeota archaeon]|nr:nucleotidyltransferase family protein [Candidatus Marsarchaeota archaeon]
MSKVGLLLCGGQGSRFHGQVNKLVHPLGSSVVVEVSLAAMMGAGFDFNIVVDGAVDVGRYLAPGVLHVRNPDWKDGMATSLKCGVEAAKRLGVDSLIVGLGDQPGIPASSWKAVGQSHGRPIAVATYHGKRRNPVRLDSSIWELLPESGDEGARALFRAYPELVEEVDCLGDPRDIDTLEDLIKWNNF